jgi:hypothetical protein
LTHGRVTRDRHLVSLVSLISDEFSLDPGKLF